MNAFEVFEDIKHRYKETAESTTLKKISWIEFFKHAEKSVFLCGGELRTSAHKKIADKCIEILKNKLETIPEFSVSIMGGSWLIEGKGAPRGEAHSINYTIKGLYELAQNNPKLNISFYCIPLNVSEATESGYLHNAVIDEGEENQKAYLEYPHGCPLLIRKYNNREWLKSQDTEFIQAVVNIRESFRVQWNLQPHYNLRVLETVKMQTLKRFYLRTLGWNYNGRFGFGLCMKMWLSGLLKQPNPAR